MNGILQSRLKLGHRTIGLTAGISRQILCTAAASALAFSCLGGSIAHATDVATPVATATDATVTYSPTVRQLAWQKATLDQRILLAEEFGEDGARQFAQAKGWTSLQDGTISTFRQGLDQVYRSSDGIIHAVEAKGGSGSLRFAYGYFQDSPEWAVKAAEATLKSSYASPVEKEAAKAVLQAARSGKLQLDVIRTRHVLGEPVSAVLESSTASDAETATLAKSVIKALEARAITAGEEASPALETIGEAATPEMDAIGIGARSLSKIAIPVAVTVDGAFRVHRAIQVERQYSAGEITEQQREVAHAKNAAGMVGGWTGAIAGAEIGGAGGAAAGSVVPGPGTAIGGTVGTIAGGAVGYVAGDDAAQAGAQWAVTKIHRSGTTIADVASTAWDKTKTAAQSATDSTVDAACATWSATKQAAVVTGDKCKRAYDWASSVKAKIPWWTSATTAASPGADAGSDR